MIEKEKVSIVIPCYNQAIYLPETLESVLNQTYDNWECIIVNDGSPDNTEEVARVYCEMDSRFKYLYKTNGGLSSARNAGIKFSSGEYILPLDSDDKIGSKYLELAAAVLNRNEKIKIVYCNAEFFDFKRGQWRLDDFTIEDMLGRNLIFCTALYRRQDYDNTVGYNENMKFGFEDWDFWLSILEKGGEVYRLNETLFFYRIRKGSMLQSLNESKLRFLRKQIWENHKELYSQNILDPTKCFEYKTYADSIEYKIGFTIINPIRKVRNYFIGLKLSFSKLN